jgi:hypothetical protein
MKALADSSALLSAHPNRGVLCRALLFTAPMALAGAANIVIAVLGDEISFFRAYDKKAKQCIVSAYYATLTTVFTIALFIALLPQSGLCFKGDDLTKPRLNVFHRQRTRRLPLFMIPFIMVGTVSIAGEYLTDPWPTIIGYVACAVSTAVMTIYLYYFIVAPLRESTQVQLLRGNLTQRHGAFLAETLNSIHSVPPEPEIPVAP